MTNLGGFPFDQSLAGWTACPRQKTDVVGSGQLTNLVNSFGHFRQVADLYRRLAASVFTEVGIVSPSLRQNLAENPAKSK